jgi:hypothetical protein
MILLGKSQFPFKREKLTPILKGAEKMLQECIILEREVENILSSLLKRTLLSKNVSSNQLAY